MDWTKGEKLQKTNFLEQIQNHWEITLPLILIEIIKNNNRARPVKNVFDTQKADQHVFGELLNFNLRERGNVLDHFNTNKDVIPKGVFPFAIDPAGNYICLDYRQSSIEPTIVFWYHEGFLDSEGEEKHNIEFVASSFEEFLDNLYDAEDDDIHLDNIEILD